MNNIYVQFRSDNFETTQPDDQIDEWHLGADLAGWLCSRLLPLKNIYYHLGPTMEDWGWIIGFNVKDSKILLRLWAPREVANEWTIELSRESKRAFFSKKHQESDDVLGYLKSSLEKIFFSESNVVKDVKWLDSNPL